MKYLTFSVQGISCDGCVNSVKRALQSLKGASNVEVTLNPGTAILHLEAAHLTTWQAEVVITTLCYSAGLTNAGTDVQGLT